MIKIYCDGACKGNPGKGGWGFWVENDGAEKFGGEKNSTNNKMELTAAIEALRYAQTHYPNSLVQLLTDSNYVVKGLTEWMPNWKRNNWHNASGEIKNKELWIQLEQVYQKVKPKVTWVKGHSTSIGNNKADELANKGALNA